MTGVHQRPEVPTASDANNSIVRGLSWWYYKYCYDVMVDTAHVVQTTEIGIIT